MKRKLILICAILALTTTSLAEDVKKIESTKQEITQQEKIDYKTIRVKWAEFLTGIPQEKGSFKISVEDRKRVVAENEKGADGAYEKLNSAKDRTYLFSGFEDMKNGVHIMRSYEQLGRIVKAYATPGTKYYKKENVKKDIVESLDWLYDNAYHEELPELGNWWQWELGIPKNLNNIIAMAYDDIPKDKKIKYLKASQYFQPYAQYSGVSPTAKFSTSPDKRVSVGGNRIDTSIISFLRGVLMEDKVQVLDGLNAVADVGEYVTEKDGFYRDGSFIQHGNVAYNGTYAEVLFNGLGSILWLIDGTEFKIEDERISNVYESILRGYSYLMINGGVNDSVNGRSVSRNASNDIERGRALVNSFAMLVDGADKEYQGELKSLIKTILLDNNSYSIIENTSNPLLKNIFTEIVNDKNIKPLEVQGAKVYGAMDRAVYMNEQGGKFVIAMHSARVANYETMNGENLKGWHTGDGMTYIYGKDSKSFTEFWPTVDMYHLPGVTNSLTPRENKSGERRVKKFVSSKTWVGGVESKDTAFVGMDFSSWNDKTTAKKSWFMVDGVVLALGSNIESTDGNIHTTIDNRILTLGKIYVDGKELDKVTKIENPQNISINFNGNYPNENIGYKILKAPELTVEKTERVGTWKEIGGSLTEEIKKNYFTAYINHGENPKDSGYAYVVLPMFSKEEVNNYDTSRFEIVKLDDEIHAVKDIKENITAINFWKDKPQKFEKIKSYSTLSLIAKESEDYLEIFVSEPTQLQNNSIIEIDGKYEVAELSDEDIKVNISKDKVKIVANLKNNGATKYIKLKKVK